MSKTIFMIHGMWGSGEIWTGYKEYFEAQGYRVIAPTLRLHGEKYKAVAPQELGTVSILDYVDDLEKEIRALNEKPIIMGHSMGGLLAQILASRGLASKLVLLTSAPPAGVLALRPSSTRTFLSVLSIWGFWKKPMRLTLEEAKYGILNLLTPEQQVEEYNKYSFESGQAAFEIAFWPLDGNKATYVDGDAIKCPILVIAGGKDKIVPASVVKQIYKKYKKTNDVTYKVFKKFAHAIHQQKGWQEIADYVADWLKKH
ncbi:MAG: alpha/beta hydrolase [Gammaproteobacteria bacterium]|nr:alpha/beta hydrolase [Gammaproteobacteria bacterium]